VLSIKEEEINYLKQKLAELENNTYNTLSLEGQTSIQVAEMPNLMYLMVEIDIVRAWYYYLFGIPENNEILNPTNLVYIYSYLGKFINVRHAKDSLKALLDERYNS
jgi:hypothetical protein